ncbi:MAG: lipoate--protein ligase [Firmicutes bacterium]|nr:lipoate--protein ligase [Bacillota bacterium]
MIRIVNEHKLPQFNLALEEYALNYLDCSHPYVIIWQNEPSVIIGRNQNTLAEVNLKYVKEHNIHVVRRLSGGGAVYHDLGNLNFTFIVDGEKGVVSNFEFFTRPVIKALHSLGVKAEFSGRNDITIDGKKFSGNAQYWSKNRLLHHGTILFNSDLAVVQEALSVKTDKLQSKGIKSVRSRVTNIYPYMKTPVTIEEFKEILLKFMQEEQAGQDLILTPEQIAEVEKLKEKRYARWEWNFGESPECDVVKEQRFAGGKLELHLNIRTGRISDLRIFGDFFGTLPVQELAEKLNGRQYRESDVAAALEEVDFSQYFLGISPEEFLECMFS